MKNLFSLLSKKPDSPLTTAQGDLVRKYRHFRSLLGHNHRALKTLADMEQTYYSGKPFSLNSMRITYEQLLEAVMGVIYSLETLSGRTFAPLLKACTAIDDVIFESFNPKCMLQQMEYVIPLGDIPPDMDAVIGSKSANLARMHALGIPVPPGFAVSASAFNRFMEANGLFRIIEEEFSKLDPESPGEIEKMSLTLQNLIRSSAVPEDVAAAILKAYAALEERTHRGVRIAMRSSAVGEDTEASFAGQYSTVLNVSGTEILDAYRSVIASKYGARAISYRMHHGLDDRETLMCVAGIVMIDARSSGVLYTVDPALPLSCALQINAIWGLGEFLVDGSTSPDRFSVDRRTMLVLHREIALKQRRLVSLAGGGTAPEDVPEAEQDKPAVGDETIAALGRFGITLEEQAESPLDIEWAVDRDNHIYILQSRPLGLPEVNENREINREEAINAPVILKGGTAASHGVAIGTVRIIRTDEDLQSLPDQAIIVTKTMSPEYARVMGKISGLITDIGSVTSHLASVAREFGVPAIVDTKTATVALKEGETVTMHVASSTVYRGVVESLREQMKPRRKLILDSPVHRKMRSILDRVSPLNLTDPEDESFRPEGCRSFHDIIRYTHEMAMREMFGMTAEAGKGGPALRLTTTIPLNLFLIDMGGGFREGLTSSDLLTPDVISSVPMKALWRGFTHPGVSWEGTMNIKTDTLSSRFAATATAEFGEAPGGESYAIISGDYMNLSARFAYHFATIDALCSDNSNQNYVSLQFSGGAGNYYGRSLRIHLIGSVLDRLGFKVSIRGDFVEATLQRYDREETAEKLDLLGRLLASCRLLDMTLTNQDEVDRFTAAFFEGNYNLLQKRRDDDLTEFYTHGGYWTKAVEDGHACCLQDGSRWGRGISSGIAGIVSKVIGTAYQEFLDTVEAYYYFPLAVLKDSEIEDGTVAVKVKPVKGNIDRAGGIAFGIADTDNYFVLRSNALEGNVILFEFINGKRVQRVNVRRRILPGVWHRLVVTIRGETITGAVDDEIILTYHHDRPVKGYVGLWTKADSVTCFDEFTVESGGSKRVVSL